MRSLRRVTQGSRTQIDKNQSSVWYNGSNLFNFEYNQSMKTNNNDVTHPGFNFEHPKVKKFENNRVILTNGSEYDGRLDEED